MSVGEWAIPFGAPWFITYCRNISRLYPDTFLYIYNTLTTMFTCVSGPVFSWHRRPEASCTCVSCHNHVAVVSPCDSSRPVHCSALQSVLSHRFWLTRTEKHTQMNRLHFQTRSSFALLQIRKTALMKKKEKSQVGFFFTALWKSGLKSLGFCLVFACVFASE